MVGEFVLRERIDEGGFGAVYRCDQPLLGREAVVKVLHQRLRRNDVLLQRFMREAQLASRLDHPYAAHVYAFGIEHDDGLFWIAMEMVQGTTLTRWLRDRGPLPLDQLVPFFSRVAEVVQTAHERGIVHRDLKPSNVMVIERAGVLLPKLLDFGIAKLLDDATPQPWHDTPALAARRNRNTEDGEGGEDGEDGDDGDDAGDPRDVHTGRADDTGAPSWVNSSEVATLTSATAPPPRRGQHQRLTRGDATVGSPPYMSPEQWMNPRTVGTASDLYALGVVAYEALTGRRPFDASTVAEYVELHCRAPVPPLGDGFSPALDKLFQRALAKRPEDRWGSALELAAALRAASGIGNAGADLPKLDETVRDAWLADAPQPLAESIATLDGAANAHQARDAAFETARNLLRYVLVLALATRAQVREDLGGAALLELVRTMRRRDLDDDERIWLIRLLVRPLLARRGAHPIPELVDLVTPSEGGADGLEAIRGLLAASDHSGTEGTVRLRLTRLVPELTQLLRRAAFVLDYVLVVPRDGAAERWTGLRRQYRVLVTLRAGELAWNHPMLLDRESRICVDLWPLMQVVPPTEGAERELFLFDGRGRHGARLIASPAGFEHHDPAVWDWIATHVIAELDHNAETDDDRSPYLGLTAFSAGEAGKFVGRESEVERFVARLRQRPLQVVVGPPGAGKSSFVHAGVIPALPQTWRVIAMRPGIAPINALAARLVAAGFPAADMVQLLETQPAVAAARIAETTRPAAGAAANAAPNTTVIVIDHLEELFTVCTSGDERIRFAEAIAQLAASGDVPIRVIGVIRNDFLAPLEALAPLRPLLPPALVHIGNPSRDALVRIVVEPARRAGYALSDGELAHDMVNAIADRPGALALLSFTASRLWELRDRRFRQLTRNAYDAMGGVGGALGRHAEATLQRSSGDEQRLVREIFRHLVTAEGTRAQLSARELRQRLAAPRADAVIDKLVAARLIAVSESEGESRIEVIHEALIDAWPRLQRWVREDLHGARMRDQIRGAALQWQERGRPRGLLWRDDVLVELERSLRRRSPIALSDLEAAFVAASRRDSRRAKWIRRGLALVALSITIAFSVFAYLESKIRAQGDARLIQSRIDQGRHSLVDGKFTEALVYLAAARRGDDSPSVNFMLARAAQPLLAEAARLTTPSGRMWSAMFSRDGKQIVTTDDQGARIWDVQPSRLVYVLPHADTVYQAVYSLDGKTLFTAGADGFVKMWDAATGALIHAMTQNHPDRQTARYAAVAVSPDGARVAAITMPGDLVHVWRTDTGAPVAELTGRAALYLPYVAFSQDGHWLATAGDEVQVFDTATWQRQLALPVPQVTAIAFDPSRAQLATANRLGDSSIWSIPSGTRVQHLTEIGEKIHHIEFSPDGAFVVTASQDGAERVWNAATGGLQLELKTHRGPALWAEFDRSSKLVVSAGADGLVVVSDVTTGVPISTFEGYQAAVTMARFDPTSQKIIGASWDGTARVWDARSPYRRWTSPPIDEDCGTDASLDEDRRFITVSCKTHGIHIWDTAQDELLADLPSVAPRPEREVFPAVSAAGDRAAIARGKTVAIYQLPGGRELGTIAHPAEVTAVAFAGSGHELVSGSSDGSLQITHDLDASVALPGFASAIDTVKFTRDNRVIATDAQSQLRIYDPLRTTGFAELALPIRARTLRISSDGHRLIAITASSTPASPVLVDLDQHRVVTPLDGHKGQVFSARFVRRDREIVTAGSDGAARRWDATTGRLLQTYRGSARFLLDAAVDPDGTTLVTAGGDGILRFWDVASGAELWTLHTHRAAVGGVHFEASGIVTRGFTGDVSRWVLPKPVSPAILEELVHCLSLRFDEDTGALVEQTPCSVPVH
jgi:WD40 repeat protein/serine/threonine protein kinase